MVQLISFIHLNFTQLLNISLLLEYNIGQNGSPALAIDMIKVVYRVKDT